MQRAALIRPDVFRSVVTMSAPVGPVAPADAAAALFTRLTAGLAALERSSWLTDSALQVDVDTFAPQDFTVVSTGTGASRTASSRIVSPIMTERLSRSRPASSPASATGESTRSQVPSSECRRRFVPTLECSASYQERGTGSSGSAPTQSWLGCWTSWLRWRDPPSRDRRLQDASSRHGSYRVMYCPSADAWQERGRRPYRVSRNGE